MHYVNAMHVDEAVKVAGELIDAMLLVQDLRERFEREMRAMNTIDGVPKKRVGKVLREAIEADPQLGEWGVKKLPLSDWSVRLTLDAGSSTT